MDGKAAKKKPVKKIAGVVTLVCMLLASVVSSLMLRGTQEKIIRLEERIAFMKEECVPLRFEVLKHKDSEIEVELAAYDCLTGRKTGESRVFSLRGEELFVDFQIIRLSDDDFVFFPSGLYTDIMAMEDAEKLFSLYDENGFPSIYRGLIDGLPEDEQKELELQLSQYFAMIKEGWQGSSSGQYGTSVHDLKSVEKYKKGFTYKVLCHPHTGGMEIVKE